MNNPRSQEKAQENPDLLPYAPPNFEWPRCPEAEKFLTDQLEVFLEKHTFARTLRDRMLAETSTHMIDWIDHLDLPLTPQNLTALGLAGFRGYRDEGKLIYWHPHAQFPRILLHNDPAVSRCAIKVDSIEAFQQAHDLSPTTMEGAKNGRYRRLMLPEGNSEFLAIERRGYRGFTPDTDQKRAELYEEALTRMHSRMRECENDDVGMEHTLQEVKALVEKLGPDQAAEAFLAAERAYWESRNQASQVQKKRQDALGLGWANHDHHTFRSSREHFVRLMEIFHTLGFKKRERYYAGDKAGWGAQILEQPNAGLVVFADVDLRPEEKCVDFSREPLTPMQRQNTVGLWCALHGESVLQAGMHHLESQFDFDRLRTDLLEKHDILTMKPFSDFPFLRQAFTSGERWPVDERRIDRLLRLEAITLETAKKFLAEGAVGSHLENLQRREGYKGFNKEGVDAILKAVDPRTVDQKQEEMRGRTTALLGS